MALNLVRNSRVFFTTNVDSAGVVLTTGALPANTYEIQVLDGFTFSQNSNNETVTLSEAGATPVRGQRSFNTSLAPVDFSFSTYMRPKLVSTQTRAEEEPLWNALTSTTGNGWTSGATSTVAFTNSNANQLQKFGLVIVVDNVTYVVDNCALNEASIDFSIDGIATIAWSGQGTKLYQLATSVATGTVTAGTGTFSAGITGTYKAKVTDANFITNKLSTATVAKGGTTYAVAITGGNLTINNNITYITPANIGVVNQPITYFTGTRSITGNMTAYLKTGAATDTGAMLSDALTSAATTTEPNYNVQISIGGASAPKVLLNMPTSVLSIPTVDVQQVVSTTINFTAQGSTGGAGTAFSLDGTNELTIVYTGA
jgi:hypothetical protein